MQKKKGVSLVALIITIIVMIILGSAVILTLYNTGIIHKANDAVETNDLGQVKNMASLKWSEAYLDKTIEDVEGYIWDELFESGVNISNYEITITGAGVEVSSACEVPEKWKKNIIAIVDGVPIPKGFTASYATGENKKDLGLVIYEGTDIVVNSNVELARRSRNQYVWVPISSEDFDINFKRMCYGTASYSNNLGNGYWEVVLDLSTNIPANNQNAKYVTNTTLAEVQAMYASVKEYEGFYIARYEAGIDKQRTGDDGVLETKVYSVMGKIPYTYVPWTKNNAINEDTNGAVQVARNIYSSTNTNFGASSTLIYSVQWDAVMKWLLDTKAVSSVTALSAEYGNYKEHEISSIDSLNEGALVWDYTQNSNGAYVSSDSDTLSYPKKAGTAWALSTGALKASKTNNIYDLSGNIEEWSMEGYTFGGSINHRIIRGGMFNGGVAMTGKYPISYRSNAWPNNTSPMLGFRTSLYIKK